MRLYLSALVLLSAAVLLAEDFWQKKPPAEWSEKDVKRLRTNSPWAREAAVSMQGRMGGPGGTGWEGQGSGGGRRSGGGGGMQQGGGGMGPGGGGDMSGGGRGMGGGGGRGMGGGEMGGGEMRPNLPRMLVRWESAAPVREAAAKAEAPAANRFAEWSKEFYVVSLISLSGRPDREAAEPDPALVARIQDRLKSVASLTAKGKSPVQPAHVEFVKTSEGRATVYLFPRKDAISPDDKEVLFQTAMGPMQVKARFPLKDMTYQGRLEL